MTKWVCTVCGYVYEGDAAPAESKVCHVGADKFKKIMGMYTAQNMNMAFTQKQ